MLACAVTCHREKEEPPESNCEPHQDRRLSEHLVVFEGEQAALHCQLHGSRSSTSWSRLDSHGSQQLAMTINSFVHVSEPRYHLVNATWQYEWPHWVLAIAETRAADAGLYRCSAIYETEELAGQPTTVLMRLTVLSEDRVVISGPRRRHVHAGQSLQVSCAANTSGRPLSWSRDGSPVAADGRRVTVDSGPLCSLLTARDAQPSDAGNYSCHVTGLDSDSVQVDVLPRPGEQTRQTISAATVLQHWIYLRLFLSIAIAASVKHIYV